jgi:hypothetical protein
MKQYILIKLRSGEEIIACIKSKNRNGVKVLRPMQIRQIPFMDHFSGSLKAAVVMENWIGRTNENEVTIPNNWIGVKMLPSQEVIDAYEKHMHDEDVPKNAREVESSVSLGEDSPSKNELKALEDEMNNALMDIILPSGATGQVEDMANFVASMNNIKQEPGKEMVIVNLMFPSNMFKNMMEEGLLDDLLSMSMDMKDDMSDPDDDLEDDVSPLETKKPRDDRGGVVDNNDGSGWGNSLKDWSPDPKDYL